MTSIRLLTIDHALARHYLSLAKRWRKVILDERSFLEVLSEAADDLARLISMNYEGFDTVAAGPSIKNIADVVDLLRAEKMTPPPNAVKLVDEFRKQVN